MGVTFNLNFHNNMKAAYVLIVKKQKYVGCNNPNFNPSGIVSHASFRCRFYCKFECFILEFLIYRALEIDRIKPNPQSLMGCSLSILCDTSIISVVKWMLLIKRLAASVYKSECNDKLNCDVKNWLKIFDLTLVLTIPRCNFIFILATNGIIFSEFSTVQFTFRSFLLRCSLLLCDLSLFAAKQIKPSIVTGFSMSRIVKLLILSRLDNFIMIFTHC